MNIVTSDILFALLRLIFWGYILFVAFPKILGLHSFKRSMGQNILRSWGMIGGTILLIVIGLAFFKLYDVVGICITLLIIIAIIKFIQSRIEANSSNIGSPVTKSPSKSRFLIWQIKIIESITDSFNSKYENRFFVGAPRVIANYEKRDYGISLIAVALIGAALRIIPIFQNTPPTSTSWFYALQNIKEIRLQNLQSLLPEPFGFYSLLSFISQITQIHPELLLLLIESISVFLICIYIYQIIQWLPHIEKKTAHTAGLIAALAYAITPVLVMHNSFDHGIYFSKSNLAISFAIPCLYSLYHFFANHSYKILFGLSFLAVASIDLFVFVYILMPLLGLLCLYQLINTGWKRGTATLGLWVGATIVVSLIYITLIEYYGIESKTFLLWQFFNPEIYDPSNHLSNFQLQLLRYSLYLGLVFILLTSFQVMSGRYLRLPELFFFTGFCFVTSLYHPDLGLTANWIDTNLLLSFFSFILAIFYGLVALNIMRSFSSFLNMKGKALRWVAIPLFLATILGFRYAEYTYSPEINYPPILPSGFFESSYQITTSRIPYTYTFVAPNIMQGISTNRSSLMSYGFFLNNYSRLDSLYHKKIAETDKRLGDIEFTYLPSPSVFLFFAKSPYDFQRDTFNNLENTMTQLKEWVQTYRQKPNRSIKRYYENENTIVYELQYKTGSSNIDSALYKVQTDKTWPIFNE